MDRTRWRIWTKNLGKLQRQTGNHQVVLEIVPYVLFQNMFWLVVWNIFYFPRWGKYEETMNSGWWFQTCFFVSISYMG